MHLKESDHGDSERAKVAGVRAAECVLGDDGEDVDDHHEKHHDVEGRTDSLWTRRNKQGGEFSF